MTALKVISCVFVFLFGSAIGSFLNVVIYRTPLHQSIVREPSHCFSCGNRLKWYDMFPIFSWIILRGKCRFCGSRISTRYMIMEALCAVSYLGAFLVYGFSSLLRSWESRRSLSPGGTPCSHRGMSALSPSELSL